jgi:hypothetical protein
VWRGAREVGKAEEKSANVDIEDCRKRICEIFDLGIEELVSKRERIVDRKVMHIRMVAAYVLLCDRLPASDVVRIMDRDESWLLDSKSSIDKQIAFSRAFRTHIESIIGRYVLARMQETTLPEVA